MQEVSTEWVQCQRRTIVPESFVEVSYKVSDPAAEADSSASDNQGFGLANTAQTVDGLDKYFKKYSSLNLNGWVMDGSFPVLPDVVDQDMGFISSSLSGEDCSFESVPVLTIGFTQVHENPIPGLTITWSTAFEEYPTHFTVRAYNGSTVSSEAIVENNTGTQSVVLFELVNFNRIEIEIHKWCLPCHRARVEQILIGIEKIFNKSNLMGYEHNQSADLLSLDLPKSEIIFSVANADSSWNPDNPDGIYRYLLERQQLTVRYGYRVGNSVEWIKAGTFWMSEWDTPQNGITATFTARDALEYMNNPFSVSKGTYTLSALAEMAFTQSGLPTNGDGSVRWYIDPALAAISVTIPTDNDGEVDFDFTCAEVVQLCANAACCVFYQDREGQLNVVTLSSVLTDYTIDQFVSYSNAEYSISKQLKSVDVNKGMAIAANAETGEVQTIDNPLIQSSTVASAVAVWIGNVLKNRKTLNGEFRADPRLDALDKVTVVNKFASRPAFITEINYSYSGAFRGSYIARVVE